MQKVLDELENITDVPRLGLALGIHMASIQKIMAGGPSSCPKSEIIYYWLTRKDIIPDKQDQVPNWSLLAEAVEKQNPALAQQICFKHCNNP